MSPALLVTLALIGTTDGGEGCNKVDPTVLARFQAEYPKAGKIIEEHCQNLEMRIRRQRLGADGSNTLFHERLVRKGYSEMRDSIVNPESKSPQWKVLVRSPSRTFALQRSASDGPYLLVNQGGTDQLKQGGEDVDGGFRMFVDRIVDCPYTLSRMPLRKILLSPKFTVSSACLEVEKGIDVITLGYSFDREAPTGNLRNVDQGWVKLAPALGWAVVETQSTFTSTPIDAASYSKPLPPPVSVHTTMAYEESAGTALLKYYTEEVHIVGTKAVSRDTVDITESKYGTVADDQFTLEAFGLPDVPLRSLPTSSFFAWKSPSLWITLSISVITFGSIVLLRRRAAARVA